MRKSDRAGWKIIDTVASHDQFLSDYMVVEYKGKIRCLRADMTDDELDTYIESFGDKMASDTQLIKNGKITYDL